METSAAYQIIYENENVEFQLTVNYSVLKKIPYYRDKDNNIIRGREISYFLVPKEAWTESSEHGSWFQYKGGIRRISDFTVYEYRDGNRASELYKIIKRVRNKATGEIKQYGGYYRRKESR